MLQGVSFGCRWCSALEGFGAQVWGYFMICGQADIVRLCLSCNASHVCPGKWVRTSTRFLQMPMGLSSGVLTVYITGGATESMHAVTTDQFPTCEMPLKWSPEMTWMSSAPKTPKFLNSKAFETSADASTVNGDGFACKTCGNLHASAERKHNADKKTDNPHGNFKYPHHGASCQTISFGKPCCSGMSRRCCTYANADLYHSSVSLVLIPSVFCCS